MTQINRTILADKKLKIALDENKMQKKNNQQQILVEEKKNLKKIVLLDLALKFYTKKCKTDHK